MSDFLIYILKVNVVFGILTISFYALFKSLTFHGINRFLLLSFIPLSFIIPLLDLGFYSSAEIKDYYEPIFGEIGVQGEQNNSPIPIAQELGTGVFINSIYLIGFLVSLLALMFNVKKLFQNFKAAKRVSFGNYSLYRTEVNAVFTYFNRIFIPHKMDLHKSGMILRHEIAHIKLGHSYDLIAIELFALVNWFNPFVILFRKMLRSVHEFQADEMVISKTVKKSDYLSQILNNIMDEYELSFTSGFKNSTIKNRIEMITKNKNTSMDVGKYFLILPIVFVMTYAFGELSGTAPAIFPIKEGSYHKITSPYGKERKDPFSKEVMVHGGIDISAESGTNVMATGSGKVIKAEDYGNWGNLLIIDHGDGHHTWYAHLKGFNVVKGDKVKQGDVVAYVGNTGRSTAPHLHYEVRKDGERVDPMDYIKK